MRLTSAAVRGCGVATCSRSGSAVSECLSPLAGAGCAKKPWHGSSRARYVWRTARPLPYLASRSVVENSIALAEHELARTHSAAAHGTRVRSVRSVRSVRRVRTHTVPCRNARRATGAAFCSVSTFHIRLCRLNYLISCRYVSVGRGKSFCEF